MSLVHVLLKKEIWIHPSPLLQVTKQQKTWTVMSTIKMFKENFVNTQAQRHCNCLKMLKYQISCQEFNA